MEKQQELERQLQILLHRNMELEAQCEHLQSEKVQLESEASRLQSETVQLESETIRLETEKNKLESEAMRLEGEKVQLESEAAILQTEKEKLESAMLLMRDELMRLRRTIFGRSSERFIKSDPNQLILDFGGEAELQQEIECLKTQAASKIFVHAPSKKESQHPVRKALPEHIERREEIIEPSPMPQGGKYIGDEVTEVLEYIPGELYVRRIVRRKYALAGGEGVVIGELPSLPLPKSNAGASLLSHLLVSKYQDHLPLHRQIDIMRREGVSLSASTVNNWVAGAADLLEPLSDALRSRVLGSDYIQVDESIIPVMDKDKPGATRKGYHWVVRSPEEKSLFFHYDRGSRAQRVIVELLKDYRGAVQSDGYGAYDIYENKEGVLLLGCWAHARRKFDQALGNDPPRAQFAMEQIQSLYAIERRITDENLPCKQAEELRKNEAYPILRAFEVWLEQNHASVLPSSPIGKAIRYTYGIYPRLARYVVDGRYRIDNNLAENAVRPLALGRKNYMFCQNHESAARTAIIYSLLGTCRACGVNPTAWLTDVLDRIQDHSVLRLNELLPDRWAETQVNPAR